MRYNQLVINIKHIVKTTENVSIQKQVLYLMVYLRGKKSFTEKDKIDNETKKVFWKI